MKFSEALLLTEDVIPAFCEYMDRIFKNKFYGNTIDTTRSFSAYKYGKTFSSKDKLLYGLTQKEMIGKKHLKKKPYPIG